MRQHHSRRGAANLLCGLRLRSVLLCFASVVSCRSLQPQGGVTLQADQGAEPSAYDAVSIKPHTGLDQQVDVWTHADSLDARNVTVRGLIAMGLDLKEGLIVDAPTWSAQKHFDVQAKVTDLPPSNSSGLSRQQQNIMLLNMLRERFQARWHRETRILPRYELIVVKGGSHLQSADAVSIKVPQVRVLPPGGISVQHDSMDANTIPISSLISHLSSELDRPVVDGTHLTGRYSFKLNWRPDGNESDVASAGTATDSTSNLIEAVRNQLGLQLVWGKGPIDVIVIDHLSEPSPN